MNPFELAVQPYRLGFPFQLPTAPHYIPREKVDRAIFSLAGYRDLGNNFVVSVGVQTITQG